MAKQVEEIIAKGTKPKFDPFSRRGVDVLRRDMGRLMRETVRNPIDRPVSGTMALLEELEPRKVVTTKQTPLEEIIATAKRQTKSLGRGLLARSTIPLLGFDVGLRIAEALDRARFDALGAKITRTVPARPDTAVKTIPPEIEVEPEEEVIEEVIALGRRPAPRPRLAIPTVPLLLGLPEITPDPVNIGVPAPLADPVALVDPLPATDILTDPLTLTVPQTLTQFLPQPTVRRPVVTDFDVPVPSPLVAGSPGPATQPQIAGFCPPCPKPTKRQKRRTKCFRQLVKQGVTPSRDKVSKWAQIDCVTGRTIKELV